MAKAKKRAVAARRSRAARPKRPVPARDSERFVNDLLVRGEAAEPTKKGTLPNDATHVITKRNEDGTVEVRRVRYKAF